MLKWRSVLKALFVLGLVGVPALAMADIGKASQIVGSVLTIVGSFTGNPALMKIGFALMAGGNLASGIEARRRIKQQRARQVAEYNDGLQSRTVTALTAEPPHRCVYGRAVVGGDVMAIFTTDKTGTRDDGSTYTKADALQHVVVHFQTRQAHAIHEVFIDGVPVGTLDGSGIPTGGAFSTAGDVSRYVTFTDSTTLTEPAVAILSAYSGGTGGQGRVSETVTISGGGLTLTGPSGVLVRVSYTVAKTAASVRVSKFLGAADQAADPYLNGLLPAKWTSAHRGRGLAGVVVTLDLEDQRFQGGLPNITADMSGALVYDVRKDSTAGGSGSHRADDPSTWEHSANAALCTADWLASELGYAVDRVEDIDPAYLVAAANASDVTITLDDGAGPYTGPRYTCNGLITSLDQRTQVLQDLEDCMAGVAVPAGQWQVMAGAWVPPVLALTEDDLAGNIEVLQADTSTDDLINSARGRYIAAGKSQPQDASPPYTNPVLVAADQATPLWGAYSFNFTNSNARVRNLLRINVERKRAGLTLQFPGKLRLWGLNVGDRVTLTSRVYSFTDKTFRVTDRRTTHQAPVLLTLVEDAAEIWDEADAAVADATPNTDLPDPFVVPALTGLTATSGTATLLVTADGTVVPQVVLAWTAIASPYVVPRGKVLLRWRANDSMQWRDLPPVPGDATGTRFAGVQETDHITIEARVRNTLGQLSPAVYLGHVVVGKAALPANVAGFAAAQTVGGVLIAWTANTELDYYETEVRHGASFAAGTRVFKAPGSSAVWLWPALGSYTLWAVHRDTSGNESAAPASYAVTVTEAIRDPNRNRAFAQNSAPTADAVGDLWVDTDDGNKLYCWNGSAWVALPVGTAALSANAATEVYTNTPSGAVTVTANESTPESAGAKTVLASVTFTPAATGEAAAFAEALGDYTNSTAFVANGNYSLQQGTYDGWKRLSIDVPASSRVRSAMNTTRRFPVTAGVTYTIEFLATRLNAGDTFVVESIELRVEVIKR